MTSRSFCRPAPSVGSLIIAATCLLVACQGKAPDAARAAATRQAITEAETPPTQRAQFYAPAGIASLVDKQTLPLEGAAQESYVLIADTANHAIRRVDVTTGFASTVAGTLGVPGSTAGLLHGPTAIAVATAEVFVADTGNHVIAHFRPPMFNNEGEALHAIAGSPTHSGYDTAGLGTFDSPAGLAVELDTDGDTPRALFVADTGNSVIRRIGLNTSQPTLVATGVELIAGAPRQHAYADAAVGSQAKFDHPTGLAYDDRTKTLYVADTGNHSIRVVDLAQSNHPVTTFAGSLEYGYRDAADRAQALFAQPVGLAIDRLNQTLLVADRASYTVRALDIRQGAGLHPVSTLAGQAWKRGALDGDLATGRLRAPSGVSALGGKTYVVDTGNNLVRAIAGGGGMSTLTGLRTPGAADGVPEAFTIGHPSAIACDGQRLYINGYGVQAVDLDPGANSGRARLLSSEDWGNLVRVGGALYRALSYNVERLDVSTGERSLFTSVSADDNIGTLVACRSSLFSFQSSASAGLITLRFRFQAGSALAAERLFDIPLWGEGACGDDDQVYKPTGGALLHFDGSAAAPQVTTLAVPGLLQDEVHALTIAGSFAYFTRYLPPSDSLPAHDVRKIDLGTGVTSVVAGDAATPGLPFNAPGGLCVSGNNLFVADTGNGAVQRVDLTTGAAVALSIRRGE